MGRVVKENGQIVKGDNGRSRSIPVSGKGDKAIYGDAIKYKFKSPSEDPSRCPYAINKAQGVLDLVKAHPNWCKNGKGANKIVYDDLISINIEFFQPMLSSLIVGLFSSVSGITDVVENINNGESEVSFNSLSVPNPYANTVLAHKTDWKLQLPLLQGLNETITNQFGNGEDGSPMGGFGNIANTLKGFVTNNASSSLGFKSLLGGSFFSNIPGIAGDIGKALFPSVNQRDEGKKYFTAQQNQSITLEFDLLNTISPEETKYNLELVSLLKQLLGSSDRNKFITDSPVICEFEITGVRFCPLATISNFNVEYSGTQLFVDGKPTSEVMKCRFEIEELIPQTRNLQIGYFEKPINELKAIQHDKNELCNLIKRVGNALNDIGTKGP